MSFEFEIFNEKNCDKLISFTAELKAGAVELAWLIDADAFYRGFEVQRSREDGRYKIIGFVQEIKALSSIKALKRVSSASSIHEFQ